MRANRLAAAINFSCQGYPFMLAGEEFGRTKGGIKNSYRSSSEINQIDWQRAWDNHSLVDYYRGLIKLRKKLVCLQDKTPQASGRIKSAVTLAHGCVGIFLDNRITPTVYSKWDKILLIFHTGKQPAHVSLPSGVWQILADDKSSFRWRENKIADDNISISPISAMILGRVQKI